MKTSKKYFLALVSLFIISTFACSSVLYADGAPRDPTIGIRNATINAVPIILNCGQVVTIGINSHIEFDIVVSSENGWNTMVNYSFVPALPPGVFTFTPSLPYIFLANGQEEIIHFSWITPTAYFGIMNIIVTDPIFNIPCNLSFDWVLPVELSSFVSIVQNNNVKLIWSTSSEINNSGFDIERQGVKGGTQDVWTKLGFVNGNGNSNTPQNYFYEDKNLASGKYKYRLKQTDFNGNFEYFNLSNEVNVGIPEKFSLSQNYPNPFNPSTKINYDLPFDGNVNIKIFDMTGREVVTIVNEVKTAGYYNVNFNASDFASGVYFYRISAESNGNNFVAVKRMMLVK